MNDSDNSDLAAGDAVDEVVGIAGKDQFAWGAGFWYSSQQGETGELFSLTDDVIHDLPGSDRIVGGNIGIYCQQVAPGAGGPFKLLSCFLRHVAPAAWQAIRESARW